MSTQLWAACNCRSAHADYFYCAACCIDDAPRYVMGPQGQAAYLQSCLDSSPQRRDVFVYDNETLLDESFSSLGTFHDFILIVPL